MKKALIAVLIVTNILTAGAVVYLANPAQTKQAEVIPVQENKSLTLPSDAVKISECIPTEGEHYIQPDKVPHGPIYLVNQGRVVGLEYMFLSEEVPGEKEAKMSGADAMNMIQKNNLSLADLVMVHDFEFDVMKANVVSFGMNWSSPHVGYDKPHFDIHMFLVDKKEMKSICPDAKLENVYSPTVLENVQKYHIPFPKQ